MIIKVTAIHYYYYYYYYYHYYYYYYSTTIIKKIKTINLIWRIELKTIKILTKRPRNKNRNQKKVDQIKIISIIIKKNKKS
jgi:hypothetical protein